MDWKDIAQWLWVALGGIGAYVWNKQDSRMTTLEASIDKKADKDELDRQRDNISKLFESQQEIRTDMHKGFGELKDIVHRGFLDLTKEVSKKADK